MSLVENNIVEKISRLTLYEIKKLKHVNMLTFGTPQDIRYPRNAENFVSDSLIKAGIGSKQLPYVLAGTKELVANAIEHGNSFDPTKSVEVVCAWENGRFCFVVKDGGQGFDIKNCKRAYSEERGYGLVSVKRVVDKLYNFNDPASYAVIYQIGNLSFV